MKTDFTTKIKVVKTSHSKLNTLDFSKLKFGSDFTDHMFVCDYKNGKWQNPSVVPYNSFNLEPSARVFHYGQAVFEGMKAYKDQENQIWLFRPDQNQERINISANRLAMPSFPKELFFEGLNTLLKLDNEWIPTSEGSSLYIRPFVIATGKGVFAAPSDEYKFMIICSPSGKYYEKDIKVIVAEQYSRAANGGVGFAKAAGNYAGQFYPTQLAIKKGYQQIIWTDDSTHKYLEEAGTMNVFFRINDTLITAPTSERILDGVTRKSLIELAKANGINVEVRRIKIDELIEAAKNDELKEIFGAGTAAVISPISGFAYKNIDYTLPNVENSYAQQLKKQIMGIQYNKTEDKFGWRYKVL